MLKCRELLAFAVLIGLSASSAWAADLGLGRPTTDDEIAAWNIDVRPDGAGLPDGQGSVSDGEEIFTNRCATCHGDFGEGVGRWPVLAGGQGTLTKERPNKTIGSYWPYLSTVFDYVHRAMPFGDAQSLTADETYALTAYLLYLNDIVTDEDFVLSRDNFTEVHLPNDKNFVDDPRPDTSTMADAAPCMKKCKNNVEITMRAAVLDVTPDQTDPGGATVSEDGSVSTARGSDGTTENAASSENAGSSDITAAAANAGPPAAEANPELAKAGQAAFRKCKTCHQVGDGAKNSVGPELNGVIGRTAGSVDGFKYSEAMTSMGKDGLVWTQETLDRFLADPRGFLPGTRMSFSGLKSPQDRAAIGAFLAQF